MKFDYLKELVEEGRTKKRSVLAVDIQPCYYPYLKKSINLYDFTHFLNETTGKIFYYFNSDSYGFDDTEDSLVDWLIDRGLEEKTFDNITFIEKDYGFFRNWMDGPWETEIDGSWETEMPHKIRQMIIQTIRMMYNRGVRNSNDLEEILPDDEEFPRLIQKMNREFGTIYLPSHTSVRLLKENSPFYLVGGGRHQCMDEIKLLLESFNIRYRIVSKFVY